MMEKKKERQVLMVESILEKLTQQRRKMWI